MKKTRIVLVGGFLGAGKTSLMYAAAKALAGAKATKKIGLVTNDQAAELVDTAFLKRSGSMVAELNGSCFCCNFDGFIGAAASLRGRGAEIVFAEPVGSCTDLSATIAQPLKKNFADCFTLAPLSVLVSPSRLLDALESRTGGLHPSAAYIIDRQLDEADMILITKIDLLQKAELEALKNRAADKWPNATILAISAKTGEGLEAWLAEVQNRLDSGNRLSEVDYDRYAEGEAVLGWLNMTVSLSSASAADWDDFADRLTSALAERFDKEGSAVAHVKLIVGTESGFTMRNLTGRGDTAQIADHEGKSKTAGLTLNARVQTTPERLEAMALETLASVCGDAIGMKVVASKCLSPGRPNPTHRFSHVVNG